MMQLAIGRCTPSFLRELIAEDGDVNYDCLDGFPSLLVREPGATASRRVANR